MRYEHDFNKEVRNLENEARKMGTTTTEMICTYERRVKQLQKELEAENGK